MNNKYLLIRQANLSDIPTIVELLQLKAEFDGCPESIEATPFKLENTLFCENPLAFVLLAEIDGNPMGFASYHRIYSTFLAQPGIWLDDLYIKAEYRGYGVGEALMNHLCQIAQEIGAFRIDWTVAVDNTRAIKFYERMGAKIRQEVRLCRLDREAIACHALLPDQAIQFT
ncbi:MAG: GNAT family N-acetyltransferase [Rhizonema sp. PD37]|nr:GNAT family N-acetyltransferase [Rhizonema sp. PD37]